MRRAAFPLIPVPLNCNFVKKATRVALVEIYTSPLCGYCHRAKRLLDGKGVVFTEIDITFHPGKREEMMERAQGRRSVPQIFINGTGIGGSDELADLESQRRLDSLLES